MTGKCRSRCDRGERRIRLRRRQQGRTLAAFWNAPDGAAEPWVAAADLDSPYGWLSMGPVGEVAAEAGYPAVEA